MNNRPVIDQVPEIRAGRLVFGKDFNALARAVERLAGSIQAAELARITAPTLARFQPYGLRKNGGAWEVYIAPGHVLNHHPAETGTETILYVPTAGGTAISPAKLTPANAVTWTAPAVALPAVTSYLSVRIQTDANQLMTSTPTIEASSSLPTSVYPKQEDGSGSGGVDGDIYVPIGRTAASPRDANVPVLILEGNYCDISLWHRHALRNANSGSSAAQIYKDYNESADRLDLRELDPRDSYSSDSPDAGTTDQIQVVQDGDVIHVMGNGKTKTLTRETCAGLPAWRIIINDGLCDLQTWNDGSEAWEDTGDVTFRSGCTDTTVVPP